MCAGALRRTVSACPAEVPAPAVLGSSGRHHTRNHPSAPEAPRVPERGDGLLGGVEVNAAGRVAAGSGREARARCSLNVFALTRRPAGAQMIVRVERPADRVAGRPSREQLIIVDPAHGTG